MSSTEFKDFHGAIPNYHGNVPDMSRIVDVVSDVKMGCFKNFIINTIIFYIQI